MALGAHRFSLGWVAVVGALACSPARVAPADAPGDAPAGVAIPPPPPESRGPEPPIELHPHPDIPPDDLGDVAADGGSVGCRELPAPPNAPPAPRMQSGPPVTNYIPAEVVMRPVRTRARCMRACYQAALAHHPALAGRVAVQFVVDTDGWVRIARVNADETGDAAFAACVARQLLGLRLPEPGGPARVTVVYPIVFTPEGS
jgi:hypothetical protein